jgi:hypothetical protein
VLKKIVELEQSLQLMLSLISLLRKMRQIRSGLASNLGEYVSTGQKALGPVFCDCPCHKKPEDETPQ